MTKRVTPIYIENKTVNDDVYIIQKIGEANGSKITKGSIVATFETSKSLVDVYAPESGFIYYNDIKEGEEVGVGFLLAVISETKNIESKWLDSFLSTEYLHIQKVDKSTDSDAEVRISNAARNLLLDHKLSIVDFKGKKIIRTQDVTDYINSKSINKAIGNNVISSSIDKILIIGGGGHAKMCLGVIQQMSKYEVVGIVDSNLEKGSQVYGFPVLGNEDELEYLFNTGITHAIIGFANIHKPIVRQALYEKLVKIGFNMPNMIHKTAIVEPSAILGNGNLIMAGAIIGIDVVIKNNCILNAGCIISHDCFLSDNVHVAPGAILAGSVNIGVNTTIGMGVTVYMKVSIGENCTIYNGNDVFTNLPPGTVLKN